MFWKLLTPIFLAKMQGFIHLSHNGFLWMLLLPSKVRKTVFILHRQLGVLLVSQSDSTSSGIAHDVPANNGLCIYHLLSSTIFNFFKGCLTIFVLLCLNPKQILMLFSLYTQLFYCKCGIEPKQSSVLKGNFCNILDI